MRITFDTDDTAELEALANDAIQDHRLPRQKAGHLLQLAIHIALRNDARLTDPDNPEGLKR